MAAKENHYAIEVSHLKKIYGDLIAVNDISFAVKTGEIFAFLGPNGAGKTTTVEMIEAIRTPTAGTIKLLGFDTKNGFNQVKERISILPQEFHSFERFTVRETLTYFSHLYKKRANIDEIIDMMDLRSHEKKLYRTLSGGLKQRLGVALSLVNDPEIVFLDEPTTGLDPKARREVWEVIANLRKRGKTVFLTTHYMEEAEHLADHIAIIHKGKIIAEGSLQELIERYGEKTTLFIKSCQSPDALQLLEEQGFEVHSQGNGDLTVKIDYKEKVLEVLAQLRHDCIEYDGVDIRRSNLEEVFLRLTGARLTEEAEP
ncbi:MAG: ABC transporter ATP-binding protein [Candidatus Thermoplasmatota archaeon]|nr:ABC transporter ATP-binding protein [Candidatus Thermoplasmatota archaeon]